MRVLVVQANALLQEGVVQVVRRVVPEATIVAIGKERLRQGMAGEPLAAAVVAYPWVSLAALRALHRRHPAAALAVVTGRTDRTTQRLLLADHVAAVIPETAAPEVVAAALRAALCGDVTVHGCCLRDDTVGNARVRRRAGDLNLTPRQLDVLVLVAKGHPNQSIASELGIGLRTVKGHMAVILRALHVDNRRDARRHARRWLARG